ncbi:oligosaccharide flippase family protein [Aliarcobacter thereius]|uniref:O-antigen transporter n=1 Tax=Aliarcobacter thereius LMG 24486 TaxID=1032240 RepID=A0A1C7WSP8_9BACT|nr:oligosaccharide flippase family protein [Aliarcobacter thereius]OCL95925.1 putative O-antigen transporter [Aliarcobacter thereius LMG 24486]QBF16103.1 polysaccharide biosynthesis protein [Aliarcobacter thereius LMG 24486]TLS94558.1 hypothetical protein FE244_00310 [Aliarcobacter thereius]
MNLRKNILNLFVSNSVSYLIPLLQFPYLTRVLGIEEFGLFVFSYSIMLFLMIITNYGFELYLPKEIIEKNSSKKEINEIFTQTVLIRVGLFILSLFILFIVYFYTDYYKDRENILFILTIAVFFNSFTILWVYQVKEMIYLFSRITVIIRFVSLAFVFLFVNTKNDLDILIFILAITNAVILFITYYIAKNKFELSFGKIYVSKSIELLKNSFEYFISRLGVSVYATLGGFVIGAFSGSLKQVAYYGVAHQLYTAGLFAMSSISTPLLPYMTRTKNYKLFFKIVLIALFLTICGSFVGYYFGEEILVLIYGSEMIDAKSVLNIFMITIILSVIGVMFGYPALVPLGKSRVANLSVIYAGIAQLIMICVLYVFKLPFTAVSIAITYFFCDLVMSSYRGYVFAKTYRNAK